MLLALGGVMPIGWKFNERPAAGRIKANYNPHDHHEQVELS